jgi:ABC-type transport system involved in cytochrome bd biosynthesis fused ATPase/permease subunit
MEDIDPMYNLETGNENLADHSHQVRPDTHIDGQDAISGDGAETEEPETGWETMKSTVNIDGNQALPDDVEDFIANGSSIRILVLGRTGAGKSTLASQVNGSEKKVCPSFCWLFKQR